MTAPGRVMVSVIGAHGFPSPGRHSAPDQEVTRSPAEMLAGVFLVVVREDVRTLVRVAGRAVVGDSPLGVGDGGLRHGQSSRADGWCGPPVLRLPDHAGWRWIRAAASGQREGRAGWQAFGWGSLVG